jgi:hypothetical protein
MEGTAEEKAAFAENYSKGFVEVKKLLDGNIHSFDEIIPNDFAREVFKLFAISLTAQGVGPGEIALSILSPKISHAGRKSGGGDITIDGKSVEVKTKVANGGRWVDARKANLNLTDIKKIIQDKTGVDIGARLSIPAWIDQIRPLLKDKRDLDAVAKTIAKGNFAFVNTAKMEKALKTGDAAQIKDEWAATGFDNYKAYAKFDGMLLMDAGKLWTAQYFTDYSAMRNSVSVKTVYIYAPAQEAMPQVELIVAKGAPTGGPASAATGPAPSTPKPQPRTAPSNVARSKRPTWVQSYKDAPKPAAGSRKKRD